MLGSEICRRLTPAGKPVRALVRATSDQAKVNKLKGYGVDFARGDLRDPASLAAACKGASAVLSTVSALPFSYKPGENDIQNVDTQGAMNLVDAARTAGVQHFVYTSFTMELDFPLHNAKRAVEQYLKDSGLAYTILRPGYFMQVWLSPAMGFDAANAKAQVYGSGENPISWISYPDLAEFAVQSLDNPAARNATLPLGGPEALSQLEMIRIFEKVGGKPLAVQHVPVEALEEQQKGATDPMQQSFLGLMRCYAAGDPIDMQETLKAFPVQLTSIRDYARGVLVAP
jgi:NADH dehydrogenase